MSDVKIEKDIMLESKWASFCDLCSASSSAADAGKPSSDAQLKAMVMSLKKKKASAKKAEQLKSK